MAHGAGRRGRAMRRRRRSARLEKNGKGWGHSVEQDGGQVCVGVGVECSNGEAHAVRMGQEGRNLGAEFVQGGAEQKQWQGAELGGMSSGSQLQQ